MSNPSSSSRRMVKWHPGPPPPPSPKILHFPRRRRTRRKTNTLLLMHQRNATSYKANLGSLFDQEKKETLPPPRRERVRVEEEEEEEEEEVEREGARAFEEEDKWRVQAEMLRAECNLLRMERELALKKLNKNRVKMETTLRSAVHTLLSGKERIVEGENANAVLEEEIQDLEDKLEELQKNSRIQHNSPPVKCCTSNFDKKAQFLQRRLQKLGGELSDESTIFNSKPQTQEKNVERKKMEGLSIITPSTSVASSASTSKRIEFSSFSTTNHLYQEELGDESKCSGRCKAIVRKIVEQVRAETEQWSQMQEMLVLVRREMEELQTSRDYWQNLAQHSDYKIQTLRHAVEEWKEKSFENESKADRLELQVSLLKGEMQKCKVVKEEKEEMGAPISLGKQLANEKRMLLRRLKDKDNDNVLQQDHGKRKPFKDIGNNSSSSFPIHTSASCSFRKY